MDRTKRGKMEERWRADVPSAWPRLPNEAILEVLGGKEVAGRVMEMLGCWNEMVWDNRDRSRDTVKPEWMDL